MLNKLSRSIQPVWKILTIYICTVLILGGVFFYFYFDLTTYLVENYYIDVKIINLLKLISARLFSITCLLLLPLMLFLYFDINSFIKRINQALKEALIERKLETHFTNFYSGKTFAQISANILSLLSLFKTFDNMKTAQVAIETNSLKTLLNSISEGALLVNKEKLVTHINHPAEVILKLIPGEIINQTISRKISNPDILENLDNALEKDIKTSGHEITLKGGKKIILNISPIKNKTSEIIRTLITMEELAEEETSQNPNQLPITPETPLKSENDKPKRKPAK